MLATKRLGWYIMALIVGLSAGLASAADATQEAPFQPPGAYQIIFGCGVINAFIWILLFLCSFAMVALVIDGLLQIRREKLLPPHVITGVREALNTGDLDAAIRICETNPGQLSNILMAGFTNITEGYDIIQEAVGTATDIESEKLIQRISYLNLCGQIGPMLGLLGTVVGMVLAFDGLAQATGATKDKQLAVAIGTALWTTVCGLLISVPALLSYSIYKNIATTRLLESEATVLDLIKGLRNAEVQTEGEVAEGGEAVAGADLED